jgi:hypothetical protein
MSITVPSATSYAAFTTGTWPATNEIPIVESFLGEIAVRSLDDAEFELLLRVVDAVLKSGAFSRPLLQYALRMTDAQAELMTNVLEALGLVAAGTPTESRTVAADVSHLSLINSRLSGCRIR